MNLLEVLILRVFLVLFSFHPCPSPGKDADTSRVEISSQDGLHAVQTVNHTPEIKPREKDQAAECVRKQKSPPYPLDCSFPPRFTSVRSGDAANLQKH
jgi:hypothetical protein